MAGFGRCFTWNRGTKGRLIRLRPGLGEIHLLGHPHADVGGPGFLADPGPFPRPSMADVMSNLRVRLEGARLIGLAAMNEGDAHENPGPEFEGRYRSRGGEPAGSQFTPRTCGPAPIGS